MESLLWKDLTLMIIYGMVMVMVGNHQYVI
jgi:hypothetical protein